MHTTIPWPRRPLTERSASSPIPVCTRPYSRTHRRPPRVPALALVLVAGLVAAPLGGHTAPAAAPASREPRPTPDLGVTRGLAVLVGDTEARQAIALARQTDLLFYLQFGTHAETQAARRAAAAADLYGTRIFVGDGDLAHLHLADHVADALAVLHRTAGLTEPEALRVVRPGGKVLLGERTLVKPALAGADDWSHPYHGPDNNPQSRDEVIRAPYLTQFLAEPRYAPLPQTAVASAGRVFKAFGHIAFKEREEPWLDTLAAFNGYNGTLLWRRPIAPAIMVHRNTLIATPDRVYFGDDQSCKVYAAESGELLDEIAPDPAVAGGTFWKWMALENGVLYALLGEPEPRDPTIRLKWNNHGWPWDPLSPGFNRPDHVWGFGTTLLALDPKTKRVLWRHTETEPIDSRSLCLKNGRLFAMRFGAYLVCLDAADGREVWRRTKDNAPEVFTALGAYLNRQDWRTNWRTTVYAKCSDAALYFSGPQVGKLLALSTRDGQVLWEHPYSNYQLVLQGNHLYAISGQIDQEVSRKFDALTGKVLDEMKLGRRACTRPTGASDAVFFRASEGSTRLDVASDCGLLVSPMRAQCQDGVTVANGLLYWWPSACDCNLTLYGITSLGPAGHFAFSQPATETDRLRTRVTGHAPLAAFPTDASDWPTFRADNTCSATTAATVPLEARQAWTVSLPPQVTPTAPTAAGPLAFVAGSDGVVRAFEAATGQPRWTAYTGGAIRLPPTLAQGRAFVGSGDGSIYAYEAATGRELWRFRVAPADRLIPVYGQLLSTWPAASGVLVENGVAYVAAGIVNYDGTHVIALDAESGRIRWQNNTSGHLDAEAHSGVSVQGHLLVHDGKLYLPGGNAVSPAIYNLTDGTCLNTADQVRQMVNNNVPATLSPRGWELYLVGNRVRVSGKPFYSHPQYPVLDGSVLNKSYVGTSGDRDLVWVNNSKLLALPRGNAAQLNRVNEAWGKPVVPDRTPVWQNDCPDSRALALARNAAVLALPREVVALALDDGRVLWREALPAAPVPWGLAVDREGRVLVSLENGALLALGARATVAQQ